MYNLPELGGGGGGEVIWAMPERNRFFLWEVFPYEKVTLRITQLNDPKIFTQKTELAVSIPILQVR